MFFQLSWVDFLLYIRAKKGNRRNIRLNTPMACNFTVCPVDYASSGQSTAAALFPLRLAVNYASLGRMRQRYPLLLP